MSRARVAPGALLAETLGEFVSLIHDAACYMHYYCVRQRRELMCFRLCLIVSA